MASEAQNEFNELMRDKQRRTQHPEDDDDDARSFLNLSDDDEDRTPPASHLDPDDDAAALPRASTSSARHTIPLTRYGANTGPKGVISDAQNFRDSRRMHRMSMRSNATLPQRAAPDTLPGAAVGEKHFSDPDEEDEELLDDEDDHDFMSQWRQSRLRELQNVGHESRMHQRARSGRFWGSLTTVDGQGYLDALEKSGQDTVVAVYIYDDYVSFTLQWIGGARWDGWTAS